LPGETGRPNAAVILHKEDWGVIPFSLHSGTGDSERPENGQFRSVQF
jgi:hypothetical protein